ncbi:hemin-degrading factor [Falsirhodobacter deserti]|uniref:hemin-degrading factor n=1 Tax=Falsirhodobacter deserti TaxID=1365611 RepID=UPI000FE34434|nr:ChuX/HutX family heme-like substrate-binding protein [Falsirhodobacter deserti]
MALTSDQIRALRSENPTARARDFATTHGIAEAELVAALGPQRINPHPDRLFPLLEELGDVMALTRNKSAVSEIIGTYSNFQSGPHASMVTGPRIDMRMFPTHWVHGFAVTEGAKRSLQVFDAAGDAIHKVHLREESSIAAFEALVATLRLPDAPVTPEAGAQVEPPHADPARAEVLRAEWDRMTDTHQFVRITRKLKMNRLGAYRIVGAPRAVPLHPLAVTEVLEQAAARTIPVMIFVGNPGCIQIHGGRISNIRATGPWINVLDPGFDLHLRQDHVAEAWCVTKPTQRGPAISVEAFDAKGRLIAQIFGARKDAQPEAWAELTSALAGVDA